MPTDLDAFAEELQEAVLEDVRKNYAPAVVEHWMRPRNFQRLETADGKAVFTGQCGDTMEIYLRLTGGRIAQAAFATSGCGPTIACGSMVTELVAGKTLAEARAVTSEELEKALGELPPSHKHCAVLAVNALQRAVEDAS